MDIFENIPACAYRILLTHDELGGRYPALHVAQGIKRGKCVELEFKSYEAADRCLKGEFKKHRGFVEMSMDCGEVQS